MPAPATTTELLDALSRSGLLSARLAGDYAERLAGAADPAAALRALLDERAVTAFQARYLADGRYKGFFLDGKYKLLAHLGSGGVGEVYLGEQLPLQRLVALKLLKLAPDSAASAAGATRRFFREARAAAALRHPNIAQLYDVSHAGPTPYMVLEHVDGTNLHAVVSEHRPLSVARAVNYAVQAARGLGHAHANGLVHRDVKPGNLVLDRAGVVRVLDLGLARYHTETAKNENLTAKYDHDSLIGTADFMAPEQTRDSSAVDARADWYGLGCTLYFLLTGQAPFPGGGVAEKLLAHQMKAPVPAESLRPDLPPGLAAALGRLMEKDRERRPQTVAEVCRSLEPWYDAAVPPPAAREMPEQKADQYRLGLVESAPPPEPAARPTPAIAAAPAVGGEAAAPVPPADAPRRRLRRNAAFVAVQLALLGLTVAATTYLNRLSDRGLTSGPVARPAGGDGVAPPRETLQLAGPAAAAPLLAGWAAAYEAATGVGVQYAPVGPDAALAGLRSSAYDLAFVEGPVGVEPPGRVGGTGRPLARVPLALRAVVPAYHLPGLAAGLRLSGPALADIFLGTVTRWSDPRLQESNPDAALPDAPIRVVVRADRSGTTAAWTDFLTESSAAWRDGPGRADSLAGRAVGVEVATDAAVLDEVRRTPGAIGYAERPAPPVEGVAFGLVRTRGGPFVSATSQPLGDPAGYPVLVSSGALLDPGMEDKGRLALARNFLRWCVTDGQGRAAEFGAAPLPPGVARAAARGLDDPGAAP